MQQKQKNLLLLSAFILGVAGSDFAQAQLVALPDEVPTPKSNPTTDEKVELGKKLYFDPRLSKDNTVSCNTCHNVSSGERTGTDNLATSEGIEGKKGARNAPTVWNSAYLSVQFRDGREPSLEEQAKGPLVDPAEMGMKDHDEVVKKIKSIKGYQPYFKKAFKGEKDPITIDNIGKAIAAYERTLISRNSPFDRFMKGEEDALSEKQKKGKEKFQEVGCTTCHMGPNFAGPALPEGQGFFQKFPTHTDNEYVKKYELTKDKGRVDVTGEESDKNVWRVSSLRNIALTAPYFHNGKVEELDEAVRVMAKTQLNRDLKDEEVDSIVAFLESLTGERPKQEEPELPGSDRGVTREK